MDLGADPTILDKNGKNFLFYAISKGIKNIDIIEKALSLGCNINSKSKSNKTLLMESITYFLETPKENTEMRNDYLEMIIELIRLGISIDATDDNNENALFLVTRSENRELINTLFEDNHKIDLNHQDEMIKELCPDGVEWKELGKVCVVKTGQSVNKTFIQNNKVLLENVLEYLTIREEEQLNFKEKLSLSSQEKSKQIQNIKENTLQKLLRFFEI